MALRLCDLGLRYYTVYDQKGTVNFTPSSISTDFMHIARVSGTSRTLQLYCRPVASYILHGFPDKCARASSTQISRIPALR